MTVGPNTPRPATPNKRATSAVSYLRGVMILLALLLPTLSLAVLGTIWLWQHDALLIWSASASAIALLIYAIESWIIRRRASDLETLATPAGGAIPGAATRTPRGP